MTNLTRGEILGDAEKLKRIICGELYPGMSDAERLRWARLQAIAVWKKIELRWPERPPGEPS